VKRTFVQLWDSLRNSLLVAVLLALPLLLVHEGLEVRRLEMLHLNRLEDEQALDKMSNHFQADNNLRLIAQVLGEIEAVAKRGSDPVSELREQMRELKRRHPGVFETLMFDSQAKPVAGFDTFPEWKELIASMSDCLYRFYRGDTDTLRSTFHKLTPIVGPFIAGGFEISVARGMYLRSFSAHRQYLFHSGLWYGKEPQHLVMFFVSVTQEFPQLGFNLVRSMLRRWYSEAIVELLDLERPVSRWPIPRNLSRFALKRQLIEKDAADTRAWFDQGRIWRQVAFSSHQRIVYSLPESGYERAQREAERNRLLLLCAWGLCFAGFRLLQTTFADLSLRVRLLVLFGFATGIPLLLLGYTAVGLVQDRRENLRKKAFAESGILLEQFAGEILVAFGRFERTVRQFTTRRLTATDEGVASAAAEFESIRRETGAVAALLSDGDRTPVYQYVTPEKTRGGGGFEGVYRTLAPLFSLQFAQRMAALNQEQRPFLETARDQAMKATLESYGIELDQLLCRFEDSVNRLFVMNLGGERTGLISFFLRSVSGARRLGGIVYWSQPLLNRLDEVAAERMRQRLPDWRIDTHEQTSLAERQDPFAKAVRKLAMRMNDRVLSHERILLGSESWLLSGNWFDSLVPVSLYCARLEQPVVAGLRHTTRGLFLVALLLLASGCTIALLLSRHLLSSVRHLEIGMEAVKRRDFRERIPVETADELGRLASTFNQVMDGLGDLEVAKIVQETFYPSEPLAEQGWQVAGACQTAGRVGGDYFDHLALPDGRWLLLIGDVSGHGTAAALVVALAKAVVCHPMTPTEPSQILQMLNEQLVQSVGRRKMMTCFVALFDPRTGRLEASNAGHNYPMLVQRQTVEELRIEHLLLGARSRQPFPAEHRQMSEQAFLCFYSDGLVETLDRQGQQIGYDRLSQQLPHLLRPTAPETVQAILDWRSGLAVSETLEDDVSVMVLQRFA